jgi:hypothetical protein
MDVEHGVRRTPDNYNRFLGSWPSLGIPGYAWLSLAIPGYPWHPWLSLAIPGITRSEEPDPWLSLAIPGIPAYPLLSLASHGAKNLIGDGIQGDMRSYLRT